MQRDERPHNGVSFHVDDLSGSSAAAEPRNPHDPYCLRAMASASSSFDIDDRPFTPSFRARW
jgi:hypothetical protein